MNEFDGYTYVSTSIQRHYAQMQRANLVRRRSETRTSSNLQVKKTKMGIVDEGMEEQQEELEFDMDL